MKKTSIHTPALLVLVILIGLVGYFIGNQVPVLNTDANATFPDYEGFGDIRWTGTIYWNYTRY